METIFAPQTVTECQLTLRDFEHKYILGIYANDKDTVKTNAYALNGIESFDFVARTRFSHISTYAELYFKADMGKNKVIKSINTIINENNLNTKIVKKSTL